MVRSYGAEKVFDYHSPTCASEIRQFTRNSLKHVLDCISEVKTMETCYAALGRTGGRYVALEPFSKRIMATRPTVKASWVFQPSLFGREVAWEEPYGCPASSEKQKFGQQLYQRAQLLIEQGHLRPHPLRLLEGGFQAIVTAIEVIQRKGVSGQKLVVCLDK